MSTKIKRNKLHNKLYKCWLQVKQIELKNIYKKKK